MVGAELVVGDSSFWSLFEVVERVGDEFFTVEASASSPPSFLKNRQVTKALFKLKSVRDSQ